MRRKTYLFSVVLMMLTVLLSLIGLFARNALCMLQPPEVDVIPSEANVGQQVLVKAKISAKLC